MLFAVCGNGNKNQAGLFKKLYLQVFFLFIHPFFFYFNEKYIWMEVKGISSPPEIDLVYFILNKY